MRQIIIDTETTGLDPRGGHRILELACVELQQRQRTKQHFHRYINPQRDSDEGALRVHGLTTDFLKDKPVFADIVEAFLEFIEGAELVIHNAPFDLGFLNAELKRLQRPAIQTLCPSIIDTLALAREIRPGKRNNLDALCRDFDVDNQQRTLHGALLDAQLLADVYLRMTRGQSHLRIEADPFLGVCTNTSFEGLCQRPRFQRATPEEQQLHAAYIDALEAETHQPSGWRHYSALAAVASE